MEPLYNMTGIPPISYVLPKLMHAYSLRLQGLPLGAKVKTILEMDQCCYWPDYTTPHTNLHWASIDLSPSTYHPIDLCTAGLWAHPKVLYTPQPLSSPDTKWLKESITQMPYHPMIHIFISSMAHLTTALTTYHICYAHHPNKFHFTGITIGVNQTQALCRAVQVTLSHATSIPFTHAYL